MTSIKVKCRPSALLGKQGTIYYQIIHARKVRCLPTDYHVYPYEWDAKRSMLTASPAEGREHLISSIREGIRCDMERLNRILRKLDADGFSYTADKLIDEVRHYLQAYSLFHFMERIIDRLKQHDRVRTAEAYRSARNSFSRFRAGEDIMLDCITPDIMESYEAWLYRQGVTPNTVSFYIRILRAVYNRAAENAIIENRHPFRHVYTGIGKTVKRALPLDIIREIRQLDLSHSASLDFARDMFMMSFYLRGMSFVDMAYLKKTDYMNGHIIYRRRKTGQRLTIAWTDEMQAVLDKYPENPSDYLLPIIRTVGINERCAYRNVGYNINRSLKQISRMLHLSIRLTMYVARHSWASAAKAKGIPVSVISEGMGHDSEMTTQIYLAELDTSVVDDANAVILKGLK